MQHVSQQQIEAILKPETELEWQFLREPVFVKGLFYGKPRYGHPEGQVLYHIPEVLANVERLFESGVISKEVRRQLRIISFVHDTFKYIEDKGTPRDWSKHHGVYAKKFLEKYTDERALLIVTQMHDEAYYCWRLEALYRNPAKSKERLQNLLETIGTHIQSYYLFFKCDTQTGDKIQTPVKWFEAKVDDIEIVDL